MRFYRILTSDFAPLGVRWGRAATIHGRIFGLGKLLAVALLLAQAPAALAQNKHTLPLVMSADTALQNGFVRVINFSERGGTVSIHAIDDTGVRYGPISLALDAKASRQFNSVDLETGNPDVGLSGGVGSGQGHWRLELETDLDIQALAYSRTFDGFLTSVHDPVDGVSMRWHVPIFNPGSNSSLRSLLRVVNPSGHDADVMIRGLDARGDPSPEGDVSFTMPADSAGILNAQELETGRTGNSDFEFEGRLGDGTGKWQLFVSANRPIVVLSLMSTLSGHLTNLSTVTRASIIRGGPGSDELWGGTGDDVINPGDNGQHPTEIDIVHGSAGDDRIVYTDSGPNGLQSISCT